MSPPRSPPAQLPTAIDLRTTEPPASPHPAPESNETDDTPPDAGGGVKDWWFKSVFDSTDRFIAIVSPDGILLEVNRTAILFGGLERSAVIGEVLWTLPWWKRSLEVQKRLQVGTRRAADGNLTRFEAEMHGAINQTATYDFLLRPLTGPGGRIASVILEGRDVTRARQAEAVSRRVEARLASIVATALKAIITVDQDRRILLFNPAAERTFQCRAAEVLGTSIDQFIPEPMRARHREHFHNFALSGETNRPLSYPEHTLWGLRATGEMFPMEASISQAGEGSDRMFSVMLEDISNRYHAEEALKESEERLRLVVRATNDVIREWDIASGELVWHDDASRTFRYASGEMGLSIEWWCERIHAEDRERVVTGLHTLMGGTGDVWSDEYRFLRGDGTYATVLDRGYVRRTSRGVPLTAIGAMMDITERRRNEEAQRFLSQAGALLESSLDPDFTLPGVARLIVPQNADLCRIDLLHEDGSSRRVAVAHVLPAMEALLSGGDRLEPDSVVHASPIGQAVLAGESILISAAPGQDLQRLGEQGPLREFWDRLGIRSVLAVPLMAHDKVRGALTMGITESERQYSPMDLIVAEDLGRRIGLALENAALYAEARRAIHARDEILNIVSHDLRNPLSTIGMSVQLLEEQAAESDPNRKWLDTIARSAAQMDRMIGDLFDAARIDRGGFTVTPASHDVSAFIRDIRECYAPLAEARGLRLECTLHEPASAWMDRSQIERVLSNLIGNAMKFTPRGGAVALTASLSGEEVCFAVADTGPGIPQSDLPHVFSRYWQATRGDGRGVGLGLAIAQGIVTAHGGRIWVDSAPERGAVFYFTVPVAPDTYGSGARQTS